MRIFLRILVVLQLLLSIGALVLGMHLFKKREELKLRALRFEDFAMRLEAVIEDTPVTSMANPLFTTPKGVDGYGFWEEFEASGGVNMEAQTAPKIVVDRNALKNPFLRDSDFPDMIKLDDLGRPFTKGPGTQDNELTNVMAKATAQYVRLNDTRHWLNKTRMELQRAIEQHNSVYDKLQNALAEVDRLNGVIETLRAALGDRDRAIADLTAKNEQLEADVRDRDDQIATLQESLDSMTQARDTLTQQLKQCMDRLSTVGTPPTGPTPPPGPGARPPAVVTPGLKGNVIFVDPVNHFAVLRVEPGSDLAEGVDLTAIPATGSTSSTPTARMRVTDVRMDELKVVVDVLKNWNLKVGDNVLY